VIRRTRGRAAVLILAVLVGCDAHGPVDQSRPVVTDRPAVSQVDRSIAPANIADSGVTEEAAISPVSLSRPPADAARAFEVCSVRGWVDQRGIGVIAGLGRVPHAIDAPHYARLTGREPELQSNKPAWIVQFRGEIRMPWSNTVYVDPACIVVDGGDGGFFSTGATRDVGSEVTTTPRPVAAEPDRTLPPPRP
jgi:hypothetical protein